MIKEMSNTQIMQMCDTLTNAFQGEGETYVPIKIGFAITKNINTLRELSREIEDSRLKICDHYGEMTEDGSQYIFKDNETQKKVEEEFLQLLKITQNVNLKTVKLEDIEKIELKLSQIEALTPMIEEEVD